MGDPAVNQSRTHWNAPDSDVDKLFDSRPEREVDGALYAKPSIIARVLHGIRDFFTSVAEGIASAFSAVKRMFGREEKAQQALRHIHAPLPDPKEDASDPDLASHGDVMAHAPADNLPPPTNTRASDHVSPDASVAGQPDGQAAVHGGSAPEAVVVANQDEQAFMMFVSEFKQAQKVGTEFTGAGRQQFEEAGKRHARKLYDAEAARLDALGDRQADYALGSEKQVEIQVAAALLGKPLPYQKLLDLTRQTSVPTYSVQDQDCFDAWLAWRETRSLPRGEEIDLAAACRYAEEFIAKKSGQPEQVKRPEIARKREKAFELIQYQATDSAAMAAQVANAQMEEALAALAPIPLPPFPNGVTTLALLPMSGGLAAYVVKSMISASRRYFSAIRQRKQPAEPDKAQAITFASLWAAGKSSPATLKEMKQRDFFGVLDQLLDLEKIKNDFT